MTDYSEEQRNELEALESIYPDSFTGDSRRQHCSRPGMEWDGPELPLPSASRASMEKGTVGSRGHLARQSFLKFFSPCVQAFVNNSTAVVALLP